MTTRRGARSRRVLAWLLGVGLLTASGCGQIVSQTRNAEGVRLFGQARYQDALQRFHEAVDVDPGGADGYYNLASVHHKVGLANHDESALSQSEHYYNMCRDRDPGHRQCHRAMAVLWVEQGRTEEAFRLLEDWADRYPTSPEPKLELARLFEEFGNRDAAIEQLNAALEVAPVNHQALAALGRLREQSGETLQALRDYQRSLRANRFQPEVAARVAHLQTALDPTRLLTAEDGSDGSNTETLRR